MTAQAIAQTPPSQRRTVIGQAAYRAAITRAACAYADRGALVLTDEVPGPMASWQIDLLSDAEKTRLGAFLFDRDKRLYLAAHSLKRLLLAAITGQPAADLAFGTNGTGRPFLSLDGWQGDFNLSHSGTRVALAVVRRGRVGIDVQEPGDAYADMHGKLRHLDEVGLFPNRCDFLPMWTLKEAVSKAIGSGLSEDFATLRMVRADHGDGYTCAGWSCWHHRMPEGYHLSVASDTVPLPDAPVAVDSLV